MRVGLVLGRFEPPHPGHLRLIGRAFRENDRIVICIGSAQKADPLTIQERHQRMEQQLKILGYPIGMYSIVDLTDPEPMAIWPSYVKRVCEIRDENENTFYRAERLSRYDTLMLKKLGFRVVIAERKPFYYKGPDGLYRLVSSGTEIRNLHKELGGSI